MFRSLSLFRRGAACRPGLDCMLLVHNEISLLGAFFRHYRGLGVTRFLVLDDRSDDGSREWLMEQPDVMLFFPADDAQYRTHKRIWRSEILDEFSAGSWVLAPDADELFVYPGMETRTLGEFIGLLEAEGARALVSIMIDMYRDAPLSEHGYNGGDLLESFPLFDAEGYRIFPSASSFLSKFPTPGFHLLGGMRHRIFQAGFDSGRFLSQGLFKAFSSPVSVLTPGSSGSFCKGGVHRLAARLAGRYRFGRAFAELYDCTKLPLVRWVKGLSFSGGAHALSCKLPISSGMGGLLHFFFAGGLSKVSEVAERSSHAAGSLHYRRILSSPALHASPVCAHSVRYESSASLGGLISEPKLRGS